MLVFHLPLSLPAVAGSQARFARSQRSHALMVDCKGTRKGLPFSPGGFRTSSQPPAIPPFARASPKTIPPTDFFPRHHPSTLDRCITLHRFFDFSPPLRLPAQQNATGCNLPAILTIRRPSLCRFVASLQNEATKGDETNPKPLLALQNRHFWLDFSSVFLTERTHRPALLRSRLAHPFPHPVKTVRFPWRHFRGETQRRRS